MAETLTTGDPVVDFRLTGADDREYDTARARREGLLLFTIYKARCGTCQYTFPFLQRFHESYAGPGFALWGVSQENREETQAFVQRFGATFPQILDEKLDVSMRYGLQTVPGIYLVDESDTIVRHAPAFIKDELNAMARLAAERTGRPYTLVVREEDNAPVLMPG